MAGIINRTKERANKVGRTTEEKQIYNQIYSELVEDYLGREPEFKDLKILVGNLIPKLIKSDMKEVLKVQAVMEIYENYLENKFV